MAGQKKIEQLSKVELQEVLTVHKALERQGVGAHQDHLTRSRYLTMTNSLSLMVKNSRQGLIASTWKKATG